MSKIHKKYLAFDVYEKSEVDTISGSITDQIIVDHDGLNNLDYASAGHTGFQPTGDYATNTDLATVSGLTDTNASDINDLGIITLYLDAKIDTTSGTLQTEIDNLTAADIIYDGAETVEHILDDTINGGVLDAITVTNPSGLTINWTAGEIWDHTNKCAVDTLSGTGTATDNAVNYLIWTTGTSLSLGIVHADVHSDEVEVADAAAQTGTIHALHHEEILSMRTSTISAALEDIVEVIVTSGLIISENADATYGLDVESTAGVYYQDGHNKIEVPVMTSSGTLMMRDFKTGGAWDSDMNAQIDTAFYNNGTNLAAAGSKWYKSFFIILPDHIHWVYPTVQYNNEAAALTAPLPPKPPGFAKFPNSVSLVYQGGAAALPAAGTDNWADIRPIIGATGSASPISDHGNLTGLADDDHTQYLNTARGDSRYYTETELDAGQLDNRYYTESEVDGLIASASGTTDHSELNNLDYASAGHTGFQPAGDYVTDEELTTTSGNIVAQIPTDFYTQAEVDTISGSLNDKIATQVVGQYTLVSGTTSATVPFDSNEDDANYIITATLQNTTDNPLSIYGFAVSTTTVSGFDMVFTGEIDSSNYKLNWSLGR